MIVSKAGWCSASSCCCCCSLLFLLLAGSLDKPCLIRDWSSPACSPSAVLHAGRVSGWTDNRECITQREIMHRAARETARCCVAMSRRQAATTVMRQCAKSNDVRFGLRLKQMGQLNATSECSVIRSWCPWSEIGNPDNMNISCTALH